MVGEYDLFALKHRSLAQSTSGRRRAVVELSTMCLGLHSSQRPRQIYGCEQRMMMGPFKDPTPYQLNNRALEQSLRSIEAILASPSGSPGHTIHILKCVTPHDHQCISQILYTPGDEHRIISQISSEPDTANKDKCLCFGV